MSLLSKCYKFKRADDLKNNGIYPYFKSISTSNGVIVNMEGKNVIMAGSNDYLGLSNHKAVKEASIKAVRDFGSSCSGSRFLNGTLDLHEKLEQKLAAFLGKEAALLFTTGFQTAQGTIVPLVSKGDYIFSDKDNHASIVTGNQVVKSISTNVVRYKHNDMEDLERRLSKVPYEAGKLIATDGVFSTFGTIAKLDEIQLLAKKYNATLMVDDAHAFGVIGPHGKGSAAKFGIQNEVDLTLCTFSKSLASIGGFVVGDQEVINYIKHTSPALIFSASPPPASVAAALKALEIIEDNPQLITNVTDNAAYIRDGLRQIGLNVPEGETAIVPVIIGDDELTFKFWKSLFDNGVFVNAFISPATPPGQQIIRASFMASHTKEQLDFILEQFEKTAKALHLCEVYAN